MSMKINMQKTVQIDVTTLSIYCKVSDRFTYSLLDSQGDTVYDQDDGYVPDFMPGDHYGDYIILEIDLETGRIKNWIKPTSESIEEAIKEK